MQSVMIVVLGVAGMTFGWFVYSKFIATKIFQLDPDFVTPAHEFIVSHNAQVGHNQSRMCPT